jgi:SAM-dependent methyltransferase
MRVVLLSDRPSQQAPLLVYNLFQHPVKNHMLSRRTLLFGMPAACLAQREAKPLDVPYVPTEQNVVEEMLKLAQLRKNDIIYDLGCGDGRIVVTAAKRYGVRGTGIDMSPDRIQEATINAKNAHVTEMVTFREADLFETDLTGASVVTLYLLPQVNHRLRPKLWKELKPGSRVVSHSFDMGDWKPDKSVKVELDNLYQWTITPDLAARAEKGS